jgi:hypothetical protein
MTIVAKTGRLIEVSEIHMTVALDYLQSGHQAIRPSGHQAIRPSGHQSAIFNRIQSAIC